MVTCQLFNRLQALLGKKGTVGCWEEETNRNPVPISSGWSGLDYLKATPNPKYFFRVKSPYNKENNTHTYLIPDTAYFQGTSPQKSQWLCFIIYVHISVIFFTSEYGICNWCQMNIKKAKGQTWVWVILSSLILLIWPSKMNYCHNSVYNMSQKRN